MQHGHSKPMNGKTVVVTGATRGIGRATAHGLAMMGAWSRRIGGLPTPWGRSEYPDRPPS